MARLQVSFEDDAGKTLDTKTALVPVTGTWEWHEFTVVAPSSATSATVFVQSKDNGDVWFDDVSFNEGSHARRL